MFGDLVHGLGKVIDVARRHACHGDAAVLCEVNVELVNQARHLTLSQPAEAEHANLAFNVAPVQRRSCDQAS